MFKRLILLGAFLPMVALAYTSPGKPSSFVNDFASVISSGQKVDLESKLQGFKNSTGNEIAVVTVKSLGGDTVENFAVELFKEWGIGEKGKDNGVLFLVATDDRAMRIEVGYGLEGDLTDAQSYWIQQDVAVPAFKDGNYYLGISGAVDKIIAAISGTEDVPSLEPNRSNSLPFSFRNYFYLIFIIPIWLASILGRSKSWWFGGVLGGIGGMILGFIFGFLYMGIIALVLLIPLGLLFDLFVSRAYANGKLTGKYPWWIGGGGRWGGGGGGGFGGFGGGGSGGGGASSRW